MTRRLMMFLLLIAGSCSEPDSTVMGTTPDGAFTITLMADPNWVRPDASLPIHVVIERGSLNAMTDIDNSIEFTVNGGEMTPSSLSIDFSRAETTIQEIVMFRAGSAETESQGEIHAVFRDLVTTLKVRIVPELAGPPGQSGGSSDDF